jgi:hypothetical protein
MMKKLLVPVCLSALAVVFAVNSSASMAGKDGVSVGRDGVSVSGRGGSVSASRDGVNASGRGGSVSASRDGTSARGDGASVSASRDGASVASNADGIDHPRGSVGYVDAAGNRSYDDLGSWIRDLQTWWSGKADADDVASRKQVNTVEQVSEAKATSVDGKPAVAEARNVKSTEQKN